MLQKIVAYDFLPRWETSYNEHARTDKTVTPFYGSDQQNARIIVAAGKAAIDKGVNAKDLVRQASTMMAAVLPEAVRVRLGIAEEANSKKT